MRELKDVITYHLTRLGWKQAKLCELAGVADSAMSRMLSGKQGSEGETSDKMAAALRPQRGRAY